ncbi:hypothetical protein TorRG33x02_083870 [Trema orientale]|uniref:Uncharacterized protein n=1 Tax=Trema orientale TaxID=63057 RepID=A0A2P5FDM0_TREOI|nr:hypothetical protein TorRG33x02_083870 [Trema orientale]
MARLGSQNVANLTEKEHSLGSNGDSRVSCFMTNINISLNAIPFIGVRDDLPLHEAPSCGFGPLATCPSLTAYSGLNSLLLRREKYKLGLIISDLETNDVKAKKTLPLTSDLNNAMNQAQDDTTFINLYVLSFKMGHNTRYGRIKLKRLAQNAHQASASRALAALQRYTFDCLFLIETKCSKNKMAQDIIGFCAVVIASHLTEARTDTGILLNKGFELFPANGSLYKNWQFGPGLMAWLAARFHGLRTGSAWPIHMRAQAELGLARLVSILESQPGSFF